MHGNSRKKRNLRRKVLGQLLYKVIYNTILAGNPANLHLIKTNVFIYTTKTEKSLNKNVVVVPTILHCVLYLHDKILF